MTVYCLSNSALFLFVSVHITLGLYILVFFVSVRIALGLYVLAAFSVFGNAIKFRFGPDVKRWLFLMTLTQFHFMFYMSRPLPNTFALVLGEKFIVDAYLYMHRVLLWFNDHWIMLIAIGERELMWGFFLLFCYIKLSVFFSSSIAGIGSMDKTKPCPVSLDVRSSHYHFPIRISRVSRSHTGSRDFLQAS